MAKNYAYIKAREALIPAAEKHADEVAGANCGGGDYLQWADKWNFHFHTKMADLATEAGIASPQIRRWEAQ